MRGTTGIGRYEPDSNKVINVDGIFLTSGGIRTHGPLLRSSNQAVSAEFLRSLPKTRKA